MVTLSRRKKLVGVAFFVGVGLLGAAFALIYAKTGLGPIAVAGDLTCAAREVAGAPCSVADDFDRICALVNEAQTKTFESPEARTRWLVSEIPSRMRTRQGIRGFKMVGLAAPEDKYRLLRTFAAENGAPDWSCPALERELAPQ